MELAHVGDPHSPTLMDSQHMYMQMHSWCPCLATACAWRAHFSCADIARGRGRLWADDDLARIGMLVAGVTHSSSFPNRISELLINPQYRCEYGLKAVRAIRLMPRQHTKSPIVVFTTNMASVSVRRAQL